MKNWYTILQVDQRADVEAIRLSAKRLMVKYHPDNSKTGNSERFKDIEQARSILCDPTKRRQFDQELWQRAAQRPVRPTPAQAAAQQQEDIGNVIRQNLENAARTAGQQFAEAAHSAARNFFENLSDQIFQTVQDRQRRRRRAG